MTGKVQGKKRIVALVMAMTLCFFMLPVGAFSLTTDISGHWASGVISEWLDKKLVMGYPDGSIKPDANITRAEFFTLINKAFDFTDEKINNFNDVSKSEWYYKNIMIASAAGYVSGYPDGSIKPNEPITRQEAAIIIAKLKNIMPDMSIEADFLDKAEISAWSKGYVNVVVKLGLMNGYPDGSFKPNKKITRAEAISSLNKALKNSAMVYDKKGLYGPNKENERINNDVIVDSDGVVLQNLIINGDLIISEKLGNGDVTLNNIKVLGNTFIRGGGKNSIHINGGEYKKIIVEQTSSGNVRIVARDAKNIEVIISESAKGQEVIFSGDFESIIVSASNVSIEVQENSSIANVMATEAAVGSNINLTEGTKISFMRIDAEIAVKGKGIIENAEIISSLGSKLKFETVPLKVIVQNSAENQVNVQMPSTPQGGNQVVNNVKEDKDSDIQNGSGNTGGSGNEGDSGNQDDQDQNVGGDFDYQPSGFEAHDVKLVQTGNRINDHQLGFKKPSDAVKESELSGKFSGWLMMYSSEDIDSVWEHIKSLSTEEIAAYANTDGMNRIYRITNYGWADGFGNTFRANQKDVVNGDEFSPNVYHLYVATQTTEGIVALSKANQTISIKPYPKMVEIHGSGNSIGDYSLEFTSFNHPDIQYNVIFYSKETIYETNIAAFIDKNLQEIEQLAIANKIKKINQLNATSAFNTDQLSLEGDAFGQDVYYGYVAAIGANGVLGVTYAKSMIITKELPASETAVINNGQGTVFAIGGATDSSNYNYMLGLVGDVGRTPKVAVFSSSRDDLATVINHYYYDDPQYGTLKQDWINRGFEPVFIPLAIDSRDFVANSEYYAALVRTCDAVWLQGGDQNKHAKSLLNDDGTDTPIMEAIRYVYSRGGVIAGTSAGMHVMSNPAFGYGTPDVSLQANQTESYSISDIPTTGDLFPAIANNNLSVPGMNIMPTIVLNDTHFDARGRLGRLLVALRDTGKTIGIGSDEGTGIAIRDNLGTVNGVHGVFIVDSSNAEYSSAGSDSVFNVSGVKLHYLTDGDTYDFTTGEIFISGDKTEIASNSQNSIYQTSDIFGKYNTTKALIDFVNSTENSASYRVKGTSAPQFEMIVEKTNHTTSSAVMLDYKDSELAGYKRTSIKNLLIKIQEYVESEPLAVVGAEAGRGGQNTEFAVTFVFNQSLKVGYQGSAAYLNDLEEQEYFVEVLRGATVLTQGSSSLKIVNGNKLEIVTKTADFENGDVVVLKTTIESGIGMTLAQEIRYEYQDGIWSLIL